MCGGGWSGGGEVYFIYVSNGMLQMCCGIITNCTVFVLAKGFMSSPVAATSVLSSDASECFPFKGPVGFPGDPGPPGEPGVAVSSPSIRMKISLDTYLSL